ncbi:MAG: addiction module protein [Betaproteobacteria bacterium]
MSADQWEAELLRLPPHERERLALAAWDSLEEAAAWLADPATDREGIAIASERDAAIASGQTKPITHEEFLRRIRANCRHAQ